jgi:hypothetical protein
MNDFSVFNLVYRSVYYGAFLAAFGIASERGRSA